MDHPIYYAKSEKNGKHPTVGEHLAAVSELAGHYGAEVGMEAAAALAGKLHDFGKYSEAFQGVLQGSRQSVDHALSGAGFLCNAAKPTRGVKMAAAVINGHHDGLKSFGAIEDYLRQSKTERTVCNAGKESALWGQEAYQNAIKAFQRDFPDFKLPKLTVPTHTDAKNSNLEDMLYTRMLFSCLVDADHSVSANNESAEEILHAEPKPLDPAEALERLSAHREEIRRKSRERVGADKTLNRYRDELYERCGLAGEQEEGLYTLTAPTGTGKTLALLHFALRHCAKHGKKRIILVLPFLSLTEQTAKTCREIFPEVLEDHSQSKLSDDEREFAANWSAPLIISTTVKFFESLFSDWPTDCRKLHRIANSVVIFDEAQSLPTELTAATLHTVNTLCARFHTTMVFSTATQPDFQAIPGMRWQPTEIVPDNEEMYRALGRVEVEWRTSERTPLESIAAEIRGAENVCAILNLRRHARKLYDLLAENCEKDSLFLLTTDLCAAHRSKLVETIRKRQEEGLPCRVVATQCIEAGVDLDFTAMYRALAPLEAIIQAAGRCNRNGKQAAGGRVVIFIPDEEGKLYPDDWYNNAVTIVDRLAHGQQGLDIHDPARIREYYRELLRNRTDKDKLTEAIKNFNYAEAAKQYQLIETRGVQVIVPYAPEMELYREVHDTALKTGITPKLLKTAAGITVNVPFGKQNELLKKYAEPLPYPRRRYDEDGTPYSNVYVLLPQYEAQYSPDRGLILPELENVGNIY